MNEIVWTARLLLSLSFHMGLRHLTAVNPHSSLPADWCNASPSFGPSLSPSLSVRWLFTWESRRLSRQNVIRYTFLCPAVCGSFSHSLNTKPPPSRFKKQHSSNQGFGFICVLLTSFRRYRAKGWGPRKVMFVAGLDLDWVQFHFTFLFLRVCEQVFFQYPDLFTSHTTIFCC